MAKKVAKVEHKVEGIYAKVICPVTGKEVMIEILGLSLLWKTYSQNA